MREVSDKTGSDSNSSLEIEDSIVAEALGWDADVSFIPKVNNVDIIKLANNKISLKSLLEYANVDLFDTFSPSGWTKKGTCPFPNHNDSSPSFYYNSVDDRFNCFGCGKSGKAVQFKAAMENISLYKAAEKILELYGDVQDLVAEFEQKQDAKVDQYLVEFSNFIREWSKQHPNKQAFKFIENISWGIDLYIHKNVGKINHELLLARINKLKEKISKYEDNNSR